MQDVETLNAQLQEVEALLEESRTALKQRQAEVVEARASLKERLTDHEAKKREREEHLDRKTLRLYQTVRDGRTDSVLAPLTADGVCGHCYTSVPLQQQADIRAGRDLAVCEGCGVILFIPTTGD
jgi:predicted  nucleic acid-binding Zn-ribbon protein